MTHRAADQGQQCRRAVTRLHAAFEQPVFAASCDLLHQLLDVVVVDGQQAVGRELQQCLPMISQVAQGFGEHALGQHARTLGAVEERTDAVQQR